MVQFIRGQKFWKVAPSSAILPHDVVKQMGRPKMKRNREPDEARKRKVEWSQSRKGTQMTCGNCCEPNHNVRSCYKERKKTNVCEYEIEAGTQESIFRSQAETQEFELYKPDVENEEDLPLRPKMICESELRAEKLKTETVPTGTRKIQFVGDNTGASMPTNLTYSPIKNT
uniref:Transposon MuDR mudrA n=1 Tax=Solanum tuberosum TaxID=4113 RepID=M1C9H8_SOLTU